MKKLLSCLTSAPSICQNVIFLAKNTFSNVGPKFFIWVFLGWNSKKLLYWGFFYISTLKFVQKKFCPKTKLLKFGTQIVSTGYFGLEFQKTDVEFEISILEFVNLQSFIQKQTIFKLGTKNTLLRHFWAAVYKSCYQIFNQHTRIYENIKFHPKRKKVDLGPNHISNQRLSNCLIAKFSAKIRILKFETKNALFGCFGQQFWKTIAIFEISSLKFALLQSF